MGTSLLKFYKHRIDKAYKTAFFSVIVFGLIAHIFKFTNTLLCHDSLYYVASSAQGYTESGRWLLRLAGSISSRFDLPWITGLLSLIYLGVAAAVIVNIFRVKNPCVQVLIGALLATFPCMVNTYFFGFAADQYMLSLLLASLFMLFTKIEVKKKSRLALGVVCLCLSLGIYQAYFSFALLLSVFYFEYELLLNRYERGVYLRWLARQLLLLLCSVLLYYVIYRLYLLYYNASPSSYQGLDSIGSSITLSTILTAAKKSLRYCALLFLGWNILEHGMTVYAALNIAFLIFTAFIICLAVCRSALYKRPLLFVLFILSFAAIPFFACCFLFLSPEVFYHPLMLQSLSLLYVFSLLLAERYLADRQGTAALLLFSVLVCKFAVNANIFYHEMEICMERSLSMGTEMLTRVHLLDDGSVTKLMIVNYDSSSEILDPEEYGEIAFNAIQLRAHLLYEGVYARLYLDKILGCEYDVYYYDDELASSEAVSEMGEWPAADSVQVIGDVAVIKLPDSELNYD